MSDQTEFDQDKIAAAAIALLSLTLHDERRVWKGLDWDLMSDLHDRGWISNPVSKAKSVLLTEEGEREAMNALNRLFRKETTR